jgi:hypothetical protein
MRVLVIIAAAGFSANAMAQAPSPAEVGTKPPVQVKKQAPTGCKLVGTVKGTKLWAGECVASELRSSQPTADAEQSLQERAASAIPAARQ